MRGYLLGMSEGAAIKKTSRDTGSSEGMAIGARAELRLLAVAFDHTEHVVAAHSSFTQLRCFVIERQSGVAFCPAMPDCLRYASRYSSALWWTGSS
jgi:hypothetical protein